MGLTTSEAITSLAGQIIVDSDAISDLSLIAGLDLPDDWALSTTYLGQGILQFSASGTTAVSGADLELFRLLGAVNAESLYGSSSLVRASIDSVSNNTALDSQPGFILFADQGDVDGDQLITPQDAEKQHHFNRTRLRHRGFDAFDDINPILIGDPSGDQMISLEDLPLFTLGNQTSRLPWKTYDFSTLDSVSSNDIDWTRVNYKQANKNSSFDLKYIDWEEVNQSSKAKSIYRQIKFNNHTITSDVVSQLDFDYLRLNKIDPNNFEDINGMILIALSYVLV